jgi:HTH-type transcriptional repressor of NAD biosynthesis genes
MKRAFVLMTALPPTRGHLNLIRFAANLDVAQVTVIVCTQPSEPFVSERFLAVNDAVAGMHDRFHRHVPVNVRWMNVQQEQDPAAPGFWEMWDKIMTDYGFTTGDYVVSSELYGATLADRLSGEFYPYDPNRELYYTKATNIRENLGDYFHDILPEFQQHLMTRVTVFGAESTGKTTLSKALAEKHNAHWLFEWARPYLEAVGKEITIPKMKQIWHGQLAIQKHAAWMKNKPFIVQDTDLFSTIGYWEQPHWKDELGPVPDGLIKDAIDNQSDLYIITRSNIPFEPDDIRYGIDKRESPDEYWIGIAQKYGLNYVILDSMHPFMRLEEAGKHMDRLAKNKTEQIYYDRRGL